MKKIQILTDESIEKIKRIINWIEYSPDVIITIEVDNYLTDLKSIIADVES